MTKVLLVAALAAAVLVPAARAGRAHRVKLAVVPLPKPAIGPAAHGFAPAPDSGVVSNAAAASSTPEGTAATFRKLGRLSGYVLEYGNAFTGASGITDVHTGVEQYKTSADAKRGLAFLYPPSASSISPTRRAKARRTSLRSRGWTSRCSKGATSSR